MKQNKTRESTIERRLVAYAKQENVLAYKLSSPGKRGIMDRMLIAPNGTIAFLELKRPGEKPTPLQQHTMTKFSSRGCIVGWADSFEKAQTFVRSLVLKDIQQNCL